DDDGEHIGPGPPGSLPVGGLWDRDCDRDAHRHVDRRAHKQHTGARHAHTPPKNVSHPADVGALARTHRAHAGRGLGSPPPGIAAPPNVPEASASSRSTPPTTSGPCAARAHSGMGTTAPPSSDLLCRCPHPRHGELTGAAMRHTVTSPTIGESGVRTTVHGSSIRTSAGRSTPSTCRASYPTRSAVTCAAGQSSRWRYSSATTPRRVE